MASNLFIIIGFIILSVIIAIVLFLILRDTKGGKK